MADSTPPHKVSRQPEAPQRHNCYQRQVPLRSRRVMLGRSGDEPSGVGRWPRGPDEIDLHTISTDSNGASTSLHLVTH